MSPAIRLFLLASLLTVSLAAVGYYFSLQPRQAEWVAPTVLGIAIVAGAAFTIMLLWWWFGARVRAFFGQWRLRSPVVRRDSMPGQSALLVHSGDEGATDESRTYSDRPTAAAWWATDLAGAVDRTKEQLREVVVEFWGATSPEARDEYNRLTDSLSALKGAVDVGAEDHTILRKASLLYQAYHAYVSRVHWLVRDRGAVDKIDGRPSYVQWHRLDRELIAFIEETTGKPGPITQFRGDYVALGPTTSIRL